jgi:hypothetical protein
VTPSSRLRSSLAAIGGKSLAPQHRSLPKLPETLGRVRVEGETGASMTDRPAPIDPRRSHHDMGGLPAGPVEISEHDYALWEKRVDAMLTLLSKKGLMTVDELRRNIEGLGPGAYDAMTYYERWIHAVAQTMIQRGLVSIDELGRKIAEVERRADVSA